jgi:hypothetical protein
MIATPLRCLLVPLIILFVPGLIALVPTACASIKEDSYWKVADLRAGMKGKGKTVMKGTKIESFDAEVLGVLKNTSPGRDLVLCRLSGLGLDKTGVIQGMSGSPIYIDGKLVGAVAYAWARSRSPASRRSARCTATSRPTKSATWPKG